MERETRVFNTNFQIEKREDGAPLVKGHAAVFDSLSENLGGFREKIDPGAFDEVLGDDVRVLFNHDSSLILARTSAKTARIGIDTKGLSYDYDAGGQSYSRDLIESMERGDVTQSSFGFTIDDQKWEEDEDGRIVRTILKVKRLFDVSPVTFPAYPDTDVAKRSLGEWREAQKPKGESIEYYEKMNELQEKL
jgi:uncharacterized protein